MVAAHKVGAKKVLEKTAGWGKGSLTKYRNHWQDIEPHYVANDLIEAE